MTHKVNLTLNGRAFTIACDAGQERRVQYLAQYIDKKLRDISRSGGAQNNESYQWLLTSLLLADELLTAREELGNLQNGDTSAEGGMDDKSQRQADIDLSAVQHLADRIEQLAEKIKAVG